MNRSILVALVALSSMELCLGTASVQAAVPAIVAKGLYELAWFAGSYAASKAIDPTVDEAIGRESADGLRGRVEQLEAHAGLHQDTIRQLRDQISEKITWREAESLIEQALKRIDSDLYELKVQVSSHQQMIEKHESLISKIRGDIRDLERGQIELQAQDAAIQQEFDQLRRDYPRYSPKQEAASLGGSAMLYLIAGDHQEASRGFRFAHAIDPSDAGNLYGLAVCYRRLGQQLDADSVLAKAIVAERRFALSKSLWWKNTIERFQGPDRLWVERARRDPLYGVYTPGRMRIPVTPVSSRFKPTNASESL